MLQVLHKTGFVTKPSQRRFTNDSQSVPLGAEPLLGLMTKLQSVLGLLWF